MVFPGLLRGWECSHSIRSEILLRYWCPDFFNFFKKYFFDRSKKKFEKHFEKVKIFKIFKKSKISKKKVEIFFEIFRLFENLEKIEIFHFPQKKSRCFFQIIRKNKSWEKIWTSISKQIFPADRMEALSASENYSKVLF